MDVIGQLRLDREETIQCLRDGQYGFANETIKRLVDFMQLEFRKQVVGQFNWCNYVRVADLLEHEWTHVELPPDEAAKPAQEDMNEQHHPVQEKSP